MIRTQPHLIVLAGPTAVGKTALSITLAKHFRTEILSADSRQFYREMNIGTAKPTAAELSQVKHHFINNLSITEEYTAGKYEAEALTILEELFKEKEVVVVTGGSGLFIKALCEGLDDIPPVDPEVRERLNHEWQQAGLDSLLTELSQRDPVYYEVVDRDNPVRVIRALEVCRGTGMPYSSFRTSVKKERPFRVVKIGLNREREELYQRIDLRMDQMLKEGLLEEVRALQAYRDHNSLQTVGYSEVFGYMEGQYDYEEMVRLLKRNSRRYAKRQLTWFSKDEEFHWFHPAQEKEIIGFIEQEIEKVP